MDFKELLAKAQSGNHEAQESLLERYRPLLMKESIVDGVFDEDLYQELCMTMLKCIHKFKEKYVSRNSRTHTKK